MSAIVRPGIASNDYRFLKGGYPAAASEPSGFDSATGRVLFRGTLAQLRDTFPLGGTTGDAALPDAPAGSTFYCLGVTGQPVREYGHIWADIMWKGILSTRNLATLQVSSLNAADHVQSVSLAMTTGETMFPQERDGQQIYLGTPYAPPTPPGGSNGLRTMTVLAPGGAGSVVSYVAPWRIRLIGRLYTAQIRGITLGDRAAVIRPPKCTISDPTVLDVGPNWDTLPDPLVTWSQDTGTGNGWCCRNYSRPGGEYPLGNKILAFWTADYEWIERKAP